MNLSQAEAYFKDLGKQLPLVTLLDWKKHTRPHRKTGQLEVRILDPLYFSIGKIARATQRDVEDLKAVLLAQKVGWLPLVKLWAKALAVFHGLLAK